MSIDFAMLRPGIHELAELAYHADPCDRPSLSSSIAHELCSTSPAHAWLAHPRLNPDWRPTVSDSFDVGTIAHKLLLGGDTVVEVLDVPDFRTKAAQEARDAARAEGKVPLKAEQWESVQAMVAAAREQIAAYPVDPPLLSDGRPELTLVWDDPAGVACRARLDWLRDDYRAIDDLKTAHDANPEKWTSRAMFDNGYDVQAAFYLRGVVHHMRHDLGLVVDRLPEFRFVVVEKTPPYTVTVASLAPSAWFLAERKVDYALNVWRRSVESGEWPGYERRVAYAEVPAWEEQRFVEREARSAA